MVSAFDRIVVAVPRLAEAGAEYGQLLGLEPSLLERNECARLWFHLPNVVIELVQSRVDQPLIQAIAFADPDAGNSDKAVSNNRGLDIRLCNGQQTQARRVQGENEKEGFLVDHIVLRTADAQDCVDLFGRQLGVRLALDKTVPEWGGRMLFFRTGKLTLEVIESAKEKPAVDYFWGIAYQCQDLEQTAGLLAGRGVALSGIRPGRKPGSHVATVKSHCLGIPTLLLQQP